MTHSLTRIQLTQIACVRIVGRGSDLYNVFHLFQRIFNFLDRGVAKQTRILLCVLFPVSVPLFSGHFFFYREIR